MPRNLRRHILWRLIYLLIVLIGVVVLYYLVPREVIDALRNTYFSRNPGEF